MTGRSRTNRPASLNLSLSSRSTSPVSGNSSPEPELESDDESTLRSSGHHDNGDDRIQPGHMKMFPAGPYCFKQPTLRQILENTAPPPYTLSAFMAYLSQNHCLETLEFTMDAIRYKKHYKSVSSNHKNQEPSPDSKDCAYVRKLWQKLLDAYIMPNGPREVNLPCSIRDQILSIPNQRTPPPPESLDPAVNIIHELMQESVLVPFLSECQHTDAFSAESAPPPWQAAASDESLYMRGSLDERLLRRRREHSPPSPVDFVSNSYAAGCPPRVPRTVSPFSVSLGWTGRHSAHASHPSNSWASTSGESMTMVDDSGSSTPSWGTPMTPPTTPPTSEAMLVGSLSGGSPKRPGEKEKGWKRMTGGLGRGLGFGKKKPETGTYW